MKKFNYKTIIKSLLVVAMFFSMITTAFANEDNANNDSSSLTKTVLFDSEIECEGLPKQLVVNVENGELSFSTPSVPNIDNYVFRGFKRVFNYGTAQEKLGNQAYGQVSPITVKGNIDGPIVFRATWEEIYDHINPDTSTFDKAKPSDISLDISIVESVTIDKILVDSVEINSSNYSLNVLEALDFGYLSLYDLTLNKAFLDTLALGEHLVSVNYGENKTLTSKVNVINSSLPKKLKINFVHDPENAGYVSFHNLTTGYYDITDGASIEVNKGDEIEVCSYGKPGYFNFLLERNGVGTFSNCDEVVVEEDITYKMGYATYNHGLSITPTDSNFGKQKVGYTPIDEKQIVLKNESDESYQIMFKEPENFTMSELKCEKAVVIGNEIILFNGSVCEFTVKPKDNLAVGKYNEKISFIDNVSRPNVEEGALNGGTTSYVPEDYLALATLNLSFEVEAETTVPDDVDPNDEKPNEVEPDKDNVPQTNDNSNIMLYGTISVSALTLALYLKRKKKFSK